MKRILGLVALAVTLALPAATSAAGGDARGPRCADIHITDPSYLTNPFSGAATVETTLSTASPSCVGAIYTVYVYDASGTNLLTSATFVGDGSQSSYQAQMAVPGNPSQVCVAATSEVRGRTVDSAPDSGCVLVTLDAGSPAGGGYG